MNVNTAPVNFDPATYPILFRHWFHAERSIQTVIDKKLDPHAQLDPEALEVAGADGFSQSTLREI